MKIETKAFEIRITVEILPVARKRAPKKKQKPNLDDGWETRKTRHQELFDAT